MDMQELLVPAAAAGVLGYQLYLARYFGSEKFKAIKSRIQKYTADCNALNEHIEDLKLSYVDVSSLDYGTGDLKDQSRYKMRRRLWLEESKNRRTHNCTSAVVKNASDQPFKYLCKYFNITTSEESLARFEGVLNDFSAAEQGRFLLRAERDEIFSTVSSEIPTVVRILSKARVVRNLGFNDIDFRSPPYPTYSFAYVSAGGNSSSKFAITLDLSNLNKFVGYLGDLVKFRRSIKGQRALMTSALREKIKIRDNFTCRLCKVSVAMEKNLLLEIDHIVPLAKGGVTTEDNLQTLCWRCNRSKGAKLFPNLT
jgi:hypothetical protein